MKLLDSIPGSVGRVLSHFPQNPLEKGQAREVTIVCAGGEEMRGLRAAAGSRDLVFIVKAEKTSPNPFVPVPFAGALLG